MTAAAIRSTSVLAALALLASCRSTPRPYALIDGTGGKGKELQGVLDDGVRNVESFFGWRYSKPFTVVVVPDRAAFDAALPPEWGMGQTQCWMVACGVSDRVFLLDPSTWSAQACEHDPSDPAHVAGICAHELMHVFHGQKNPTGDFTGCDAIGWFVEGLATYSSGQLEREHAGRAREAFASGAAPKTLEEAWSGQYRYGVAGSLVAYIDHAFGRKTLLELLAATSEEQILDRLDLTEDGLLAGWKQYVEQGD